MPEMQNLNRSAMLVQTIVDVQWWVEQPPDPSVSFYRRTDVGRGLQQFDVIKQAIGKLFRSFGMFLPRPLENLLQIG
jgi:hypothetical protein